ncbi:hypothetical protein G6F46_008358 [Rhizopus delemar]|uniref:NAB co-repressor domain-containing protein n=2 Tax=Rhizopus TaxID=4842 RepID=A0A9P6YUL6_9FUNG|nr:hypothetical protein G6F55_011569 [Rhizopus delemar]KAG1536487.1 hypothetical protein G6F51_010943 [Rhizopus arrhizus]KAG1495302.1 hypothetical protein G6F54_007269 [Rhizopus delemar]KAG1511008.1 hypothetical protein G6F53_006257 [Rhizopus delemar]KAG1511416.1 hypothetical protein G6F52_010655 [Rhizopus delemar]
MTSTLPTIKEFLTSVKLEQYHEAFIKSGATEQDIELMIEFSDEELNEFTCSLSMLPFHSIIFKNGIRRLRDTLASDNNRDTVIKEDKTSQDIIAIQATIYGRRQSRPLTNYEKAINEAAIQLASEDPLLISKKGDLFRLAKKKLLDDGYVYKRGKSRSKLTKEVPQLLKRQSSSLSDKRQENAERTSLERLEKIKYLEKRVEDLLKTRQLAENELEVGSFDVHDKPLMEAKIVNYEEEKRQLTRQISKLKSQERKHKWYYRRKSVKLNDNSSSICSSNSSSSSISISSIGMNNSQITEDDFNSQLSSSTFNEEEEERAFSIYSIEIPHCSRESDVRRSNKQ